MEGGLFENDDFALDFQENDGTNAKRKKNNSKE